MALAASLAPSDVAALDAATFAALDRALDARWTRTEEMLATLCELVSSLIVVQLRRGGYKGTLTPVKIPRPAAGPRERPKPQSGFALAALIGSQQGGPS